MKYKKIYDVLQKSHARITYEDSGWRGAYGDGVWIALQRPLWIVAEEPQLKLRLWIMHFCGVLSVTTADMSYPTDSQEYHTSHTQRNFRNQGLMAAYLKELLLNEPEAAE